MTGFGKALGLAYGAVVVWLLTGWKSNRAKPKPVNYVDPDKMPIDDALYVYHLKFLIKLWGMLEEVAHPGIRIASKREVMRYRGRYQASIGQWYMVDDGLVHEPFAQPYGVFESQANGIGTLAFVIYVRCREPDGAAMSMDYQTCDDETFGSVQVLAEHWCRVVNHTVAEALVQELRK